MAPNQKRESNSVILARIDEQMKQLKADVGEVKRDIKTEIKDARDRITRLETWRHKMQGAWFVIVIIAAAASTITALIVQYIKQ